MPLDLSYACVWEQRLRWLLNHLSYRAVANLVGSRDEASVYKALDDDDVFAAIDRCRAMEALMGPENGEGG